jgi:hypothetical protein
MGWSGPPERGVEGEIMSARALGAVLLASLVTAGIAHGELFRWVDQDGNVHYSDQPPPPSAKDVQQKQLSSKPGDQPVPYQLQQAVRNFPVSFYVSNCGEGCTQARQLLAKRGIPHTEYDATDPGFQEQLKKLTGGELVVPVLRVGRSVLRGFEAGQWNAALDTAGYPGTALIKVTPIKAQPPAPPAATAAAPAQAAEAPQNADAAPDAAPAEQGESEN